MFAFDRNFQISTSVLPEAIPVKINLILSAEIPKDHSNALVLLDTSATTMEKLVKVAISHLITF